MYVVINVHVFLLQLFVREPEERLGVKGNIRQHSFFNSTDWSALEQRQVAPPFRPTLVSTKGNSLCFMKQFKLLRWSDVLSISSKVLICLLNPRSRHPATAATSTKSSSTRGPGYRAPTARSSTALTRRCSETSPSSIRGWFVSQLADRTQQQRQQ